MPHIRVIILDNQEYAFKILKILKNESLQIREAFRKNFPMYPIESIALIPEMLADWMIQFSDNVLPMEFVIDIGKQENPVTNKDAEAVRKTLLSYIPDLSKINFGLWIREMPSNGFVENTPE